MMISILIMSREGKMKAFAFDAKNDENIRRNLKEARDRLQTRGGKIVRVLRDITHEWKSVIDSDSETEGG